jgi:hypothetical protein
MARSAWPCTPTIDFPAGGSSSVRPAIAAVACAIACFEAGVSRVRLLQAARRLGDLSRSSLISRLVARMPRASVLSPPVTTCLPRKTSPSSVATGTATVGAMRVGRFERIGDHAPPMTA